MNKLIFISMIFCFGSIVFPLTFKVTVDNNNLGEACLAMDQIRAPECKKRQQEEQFACNRARINELRQCLKGTPVMHFPQNISDDEKQKMILDQRLCIPAYYVAFLRCREEGRVNTIKRLYKKLNEEEETCSLKVQCH